MLIAVGSKNPVKIKAAENAFKRAFGKVEVKGVDVDSGVSGMPSSWEETALGAINRAKNAIKAINADFGVGLEGGYEKIIFGDFMIGATAIIDKNGRIGISKGNSVLLPKIIVERLDKGEELGRIMDEIQGIKNTKQMHGASGFFTKNLTSRQESFESSIVFALARFLRKELYE